MNAYEKAELRRKAMVAACEGVETEALERLAEAGGVQRLVEAAQALDECSCDECAPFFVILDAIGPLEDTDE